MRTEAGRRAKLDKGLTRKPSRVADWRKLAEARCAATGSRLTPARLSAYTELVASGRPLSAYELIARLEQSQQRKIAPLTVYRHLDFLMRIGLVHRLESIHSYVPCHHPEQAHGSRYLLCSACGRAHELESGTLEKLLDEVTDQHGFQPEKSVVEITGRCGDCASSAGRGS